jgi:hypothetical protein
VCQIGRPPILPAIIGGSKCPCRYLVNHLRRMARATISTAGVRKTVSSHKTGNDANIINIVSPWTLSQALPTDRVFLGPTDPRCDTSRLQVGSSLGADSSLNASSLLEELIRFFSRRSWSGRA